MIRKGGFTLIEMVVALALMGLISIVLFESLRLGQHAHHKVIARGDASWDVFAAQRLIRNILESAYPQEPIRSAATPVFGLEGDRQTIAVTAPAFIAQEGGGLLRYEIFQRATADRHQDIVVKWWPQSAGDAPSGAAQEVLIEKIESVEWGYLAPTAAAGGHIAEQSWQTQWRATQSLPAAIRLRVNFAPGDDRRWPDLIVAPRITDDANCAFDVVAQRCRGVS
jgi:general secretion pathway protein J